MENPPITSGAEEAVEEIKEQGPSPEKERSWLKEGEEFAERDAELGTEIANLEKEIEGYNRSVQENTAMERFGAENGFSADETKEFIELKVRAAEMRIRALEEDRIFLRTGERPSRQDDSFRPEAEIEAIRHAPREERKERLDEFKQKLAEQKEGLAAVQQKIAEEIRKNPDAAPAFFMKFIEDAQEKYGINEQQKETAESIIAAYAEKHKNVEKIRNEYPQDRELFKHLFGKEPQGFVEVVKGPMTLYVRCFDATDYALIYTQKFYQKEASVTLGDTAVANMSGGVSIHGCLDGSLEGTIIAENTANLIRGFPKNNEERKERSNEIHAHEEQHAIKKLFREKRVASGLFQKVRAAKTAEDLEAVFRLRARNIRGYKAEERAKDEFLAYHKDGTVTPATIERLLRKKSEGGLYDYLAEERASEADMGSFEQWIRIEDSGVRKKIPKLWKEAEDHVYGAEYEALIRKSGEAIMRLELKGYPKDQVIALLIHEPLARWDKVVDRLLEQKK